MVVFVCVGCRGGCQTEIIEQTGQQCQIKEKQGQGECAGESCKRLWDDANNKNVWYEPDTERLTKVCETINEREKEVRLRVRDEELLEGVC